MGLSLGCRSLATRIACLAALLLTALAVAAPLAHYLSGPGGVKAASLAMMIALGGAASSLVVCQMLSAPSLVMHATAVCMLLRMTPAMAAVIAVHFGSPALAAAGFASYQIVFYLLALLAETVLAVTGLQAARRLEEAA